MVEAARAAEARQEIPDALLPGLYLVIQPSGAKGWALRYRAAGKPAKLTLGKYPTLGLAEARQEAAAAARLVAAGGDPGAARKAAKAEEEAAARDTVAAQVEAYYKRHLADLKSGDAAHAFLRRGPVAAWGDRPITAVTKRDVVEMIDAFVDKGSPLSGNRTLAHTRAFFGWCRDRGVIQTSPAEGVRPPVAERSRDRVLTDDEIRLLWKATGAQGAPFGALYRLLLLSGQRLREVAGMSDRELDGDLWTIPGERAKNEAHVVPLSPEARAVLDGVPRLVGSRWIFTTTGVSPTSGFAKGKARLDRLMAESARKEIPEFVIHDLRRTAASGMARLAIAPHIIESVINHRSGIVSGIARVYNRNDYLGEKRAALEAWGRHVLEIVRDR